ncbi:hypothetical protein LZ30DRAFT_692060 [Colletotrichum cereale]|nr:hypothetical protein LZ30DRAFT_692060 [Colletotrichum cereale]
MAMPPLQMGNTDTTTATDNALGAAIALFDIQTVIMFPVATRKRFAADAPTAPPYSSQRYRDALNELQGKDMLPEERDFLSWHERHHNGGDDAGTDTESTLSTALTDFTIENGENQALRHATKIVDMYQNELHRPEGYSALSPRPGRRSRRAGAGKHRTRPDPVPDHLSLSDVSDAASTLADVNKPPAGSSPFPSHPDASPTTYPLANVVSNTPTHQQPSALQRRSDLVAAQDKVRREYEQCGKRMAELDVRMRTITGELIRLDRVLGHEQWRS